MKNLFFCIAFLVFFSHLMNAQVGINADNSAPDPSSMLDVKSTSGGMLIPRMSQSQILEISNPANGLQVFCTTDSKMYIFIAELGQWGQWKEVAYGAGTLIKPFTCGMSLRIHHIAGIIAPVNKTTTYGTVSDIPGEIDKCWITSNLGSDHEAAAVNDVTDESAGWYWQFNRMQGYMNVGTSLIPAWTITSINESSNWNAAEDPCTLELGSPWRIPTYTEWNDIYNAGGWSNWNGPWNSGLKLHGAGYIYNVTGLLYMRGSTGDFWSGTQWISTHSWGLSITSGNCNVSYQNNKAGGMSLRCLKE